MYTLCGVFRALWKMSLASLVPHTLSHTTGGGRAQWVDASLVYLMSSRAATASRWDTVSRKEKKDKEICVFNVQLRACRSTICFFTVWGHSIFTVRKGIINHIVVVAHHFNPSIWEAEAGGFGSSLPAWSTEGVYRQWKGEEKRNERILFYRIVLESMFWIIIMTHLHQKNG